MAYLSNNHCLETLEFTMDAGRYRKHYAKMLSRAVDGAPPSRDCEYVHALWQRLVDAYIRPNGSREVNLPSDVRDAILKIELEMLPPAPEILDPAVAKIYELMEDSVLVPFLNSAHPQTAHTTASSFPDSSYVMDTMSSASYEDRSTYHRRKRHTRSSPPPQSAVEPHAHSYAGPGFVNRKSAPPSTSTTSVHKGRFSVKLSPTSSSPAATTQSSLDGLARKSDPSLSATASGPGMTDDTGSTDSPLGESPMTPPTSPPINELSPKRESGMLGWKKLGRLSGIKVGRKKSQGGLKEEQ